MKATVHLGPSHSLQYTSFTSLDEVKVVYGTDYVMDPRMEIWSRSAQPLVYGK